MSPKNTNRSEYSSEAKEKQNQSPNNEKSSRRWIWIILIGLLLGCGGYVFMQKQSTDQTVTKRDPMAQKWDTIQRELSGELKIEQLKVVSSDRAAHDLKSACTQGECSYLKACLSTNQKQLDKLVSFSPERQKSAQYAYQLNTCAIGKISERLIALRGLAAQHAPNLNSILSRFKAKDHPWRPCVDSQTIKVLTVTRDVFKELPPYTSKLYAEGDTPRFINHVKQLVAQDRSGKGENFFGELIRGRYTPNSDPLSAEISKLLKELKRAVRSPGKSCK